MPIIGPGERVKGSKEYGTFRLHIHDKCIQIRFVVEHNPIGRVASWTLQSASDRFFLPATIQYLFHFTLVSPSYLIFGENHSSIMKMIGQMTGEAKSRIHLITSFFCTRIDLRENRIRFNQNIILQTGHFIAFIPAFTKIWSGQEDWKQRIWHMTTTWFCLEYPSRFQGNRHHRVCDQELSINHFHTPM